ncbi:hypothetical protein STEG23_016890, partial [Scotinomys teguina]
MCSAAYPVIPTSSSSHLWQTTASSSTPDPLESHKRTKLHNCDIYVECLGQSHAGFLVVGSLSVNPYEPRLIDSVYEELCWDFDGDCIESVDCF